MTLPHFWRMLIYVYSFQYLCPSINKFLNLLNHSYISIPGIWYYPESGSIGREHSEIDCRLYDLFQGSIIYKENECRGGG
jgi:hypothetical protein